MCVSWVGLRGLWQQATQNKIQLSKTTAPICVSFVSDAYLFAEILMQRPLKLHKYQLKLSLSDEDMKYMTGMARERFEKITVALRQMPKNLLLVIRYELRTRLKIEPCSAVLTKDQLFQKYQHDSGNSQNARRSLWPVPVNGEERDSWSFCRRKCRHYQKNQRIQSIPVVRVSPHHRCV